MRGAFPEVGWAEVETLFPEAAGIPPGSREVFSSSAAVKTVSCGKKFCRFRGSTLARRRRQYNFLRGSPEGFAPNATISSKRRQRALKPLQTAREPNSPSLSTTSAGPPPIRKLSYPTEFNRAP